MRLINHHLFNKQNHIDEEQLSRAGSRVYVVGGASQSGHFTDLSLSPPFGPP